MSMKKDYEDFMARKEAFLLEPMSKMWTNQEKRYIKPFQMFGNLYFVGETWVCAHLIDTGDGLLLIDAGNFNTSGMLINAIWELGFNPARIKWVIISHGHVDHIGSATFLRNMFGCKLYLGEPDAKMFKTNPELSYIQYNPNIADDLFEPDVVLRDGDVLKFGNTEMKFVMVPGHSIGTIACFFDVIEGTEKKRAGYYGGFGFNTLTKDYLQEIGDTEYEMRKIYISSLKKVMDEPVDIFLGNHTHNNNIIEKRKSQVQHPGTNPYIDPKEWRQYLSKKKEELIAFNNDPENH
jgi:metallo-beta-lactamase class B